MTVDVEYYGRYFEKPPPKAKVQGVLDDFVATVTDHYGRSPVIYVTGPVYRKYVAGAYPHSPIWIRSIAAPPRMKHGEKWSFWQYSNRDRTPVRHGNRPYLDVNVFNGSKHDLATLGR